MKLDVRKTMFYEKYKAIIVGTFYAILVLMLSILVTSCKTGSVVTKEYVSDSTAIVEYQKKIDSLSIIISNSVSKAVHQHKMDSLLTLSIKEETESEKEGTIINYNEDGSIKSREDYRINSKGKKDTNKELSVSTVESYENIIQELTTNIEYLTSQLDESKKVDIHKDEKVKETKKDGFLTRIRNKTWWFFFMWFVATILYISLYVWKKCKTVW